MDLFKKWYTRNGTNTQTPVPFQTSFPASYGGWDYICTFVSNWIFHFSFLKTVTYNALTSPNDRTNKQIASFVETWKYKHFQAQYREEK